MTRANCVARRGPPLRIPDIAVQLEKYFPLARLPEEIQQPFFREHILRADVKPRFCGECVVIVARVTELTGGDTSALNH